LKDANLVSIAGGIGWVLRLRKRKTIMAIASAKEKSIYGIHPGVLMTQKWIADLKDKTGRSLDEWLKLIKKSGPKDEKARREWLKTEHGLGTNSAWWLAERADGKGTEVGDPT
jgi:hypothetical protein